MSSSVGNAYARQVKIISYICIRGVLPLKEILQAAYKNMWWISLWGTWRYAWLAAEMEASMSMRKNIDDIYLLVFNTMNLGQGHTGRDFDLLLHILQMREDYIQASMLPNLKLFTLDMVCRLAGCLHADSHPNAWKVVYELARTHGLVGGNAEIIRSTLESLKDKRAADGTRVDGLCRQTRHKQCFHYVVQLYESVLLSLRNQNAEFDYTQWVQERMVVDFDDEMRTAMTNARIQKHNNFTAPELQY